MRMDAWGWDKPDPSAARNCIAGEVIEPHASFPATLNKAHSCFQSRHFCLQIITMKRVRVKCCGGMGDEGDFCGA